MRIAMAIVIVLMWGNASLADEQKAYEAAAAHIATAKLCSTVTGDNDRYRIAVERRHESLVEAGISQDEAEERIATIEASIPTTAPASFTDQFCRDMLDMFEK